MAAALAVAGCDCSDPNGPTGAGGGSGSGGGSGAGGGSGTGGGAGGGSGGDAGPEVCDGYDNDGNGRIDDIDVGGDGICDCLNVGILGVPGVWGGGSALDAWLSVRGSIVVNLDDAVLTDQVLAPYDVLIVNDISNYTSEADRGIHRDYSAAEATALANFVKNGGGIITMTGYWEDPEDLENVNLLLSEFGMSYAQAPYLSGGLTDIDFWEDTHPLANGITSIGVDNGHEPTGAGDAVAWEDALDGSVVAGLAQSGTSAVGSGKVFVWGDEWIAYDELWVGPEGAGYQIEQLWVNVMNWLKPAESCQIVIVPL